MFRRAMCHWGIGEGKASILSLSVLWRRFFWVVCVVFCESHPGSWLVVICERSENRGSGGGSCLNVPKTS